ncbi:MAG: endopeptidase La [Chloroflexi bacterium]|nr:endopeptidase La [Chloroflexota bacterium]
MVTPEDGGVKAGDQPGIPAILPVLPSGETIVYPFMVFPIAIAAADERRAKLIDEAAAGDKMIGLVGVARPNDQPSFEDLYGVGTAAAVIRMLKLPDGTIQALLQGRARIRFLESAQTEPYLKARVEELPEEIEEGVEVRALMKNVQTLFEKMLSLASNATEELIPALSGIQEPGTLADFIAANAGLSAAERQDLLETLPVNERFRKLTKLLNRELEILELGNKIQSQVKDEMTKAQRDYYLREQLKAIQKELGETDERTIALNEMREKIKQADLPPEAAKEAERELGRLASMSPASAEYSVAKTYLDWVIALPWHRSTVDNLDIDQAEAVLNEDHYDLEKVKDRILDYLAVRKLKENMRGPILCFVGPPGVGKTSLGQSIARSLGRKFIRMSLGGVRDEAEIRGHRRTYVGALPGRIIQAIRRAESNNPVFMLDEVDKLGADFRGDPSAALLEVLDPEQNFAFVDHYLDVPFDLSNVMFITTANLLDPIPPALRDRMEVLALPGYTEDEKLHIARRYLVPRQIAENGLDPERIQFEDAALATLIRHYTREAGVRNLEREIGTVCRKVARGFARGSQTQMMVIRAEDLHDYLGPQRFHHELAEENDEVGVATGLAVTAVGGDILFVEATLIPGHGALMLTGQLGGVMQESARAGVTYARSRAQLLGVPEDWYEKLDIHIHIPAGAIPKDGPSAGVTMATALISTMTGRPVSKDVAMTGEITLRGRVLPVGGIKEKVLAAHRAGVKTVILPADNEKDLEEVPPQVREELRLVFARNVDDVLHMALKEKRGAEPSVHVGPESSLAEQTSEVAVVADSEKG